MIYIPPSNFGGFHTEITFHTLVCFDASFVSKATARAFEDGTLKNLGIAQDETYELIDWTTREVVQRAFPELYTLSHPHIDKFQQFYDQTLFGSEFRIRDTLANVISFKKPPKLLKVLPMNERTIIAIGT